MTLPLHTVASRWPQQRHFSQLELSFTAERKAADEKRLREIFKAAARVPALYEALEWADKRGAKYLIDHTCINVGGYYTMGTGVVALAYNGAYEMGMHEPVRVLTHEIRHLWQDWHGMIPTVARNFADYFIRLSLVEADARAHEQLATTQFDIARFKKYPKTDYQRQTYLESYKKMTANKEEFLWNKFLQWYSCYDTATRFYGDHASKSIGQDRGIPSVVPPDRRYEFKPYSPYNKAPDLEGISTSSIDSILHLGRSYNSNKNYFRGQAQKDDLLKKIIVPSLSSTFYGVASPQQCRLVEKIRKIDLRRGDQPKSIAKFI